MFLDDIKTQFVWDRVKETSWRDREYIAALKFMEAIILDGGPKHLAEAMGYNCRCKEFPVEADCIRKEIKEGVYTSPAEFRKLLNKYRYECELRKLEEMQAREEAMTKERAQEEEEWKLWLDAGGRS